MAETQWQVTGLKELGEFLKELPIELRRGVVRKALRKAAKLVETEAKRLAPVLKARVRKSGSKKPYLDPRRIAETLRDAIRVGGAFGPAGGTEVIVKVGIKKLHKTTIEAIRRGDLIEPRDPFYAMFVERGTSRTPAQSFMRPALESQGFAVVEQFKEEFRRGLDDFAKKLLLHKGRRSSGA